MLRDLNQRVFVGALTLSLLFTISPILTGMAQTSASLPAVSDVRPVITNLQQLASVVDAEPRIVGSIRLEVVVCAVSQPDIGVVVAHDASGAELLELGAQPQVFQPGDRLRIEGARCLLRRRDLGVSISAAPVVENDGVHGKASISGEIELKAGRYPLQLDWFNRFRDYFLEVTCQRPDAPPEKISESALWHVEPEGTSGRTNFLPGLRAECFEGNWENVPDFELFHAVKTGVVTNFDLQFRTRDTMVALRFTGFFDAPVDGKYIFSTRSDDGSFLFIGNREVKIDKLGVADVPPARTAIIGEVMAGLDERTWLTVAGRVSFVRAVGKGMEFELRSERDTLRVNLADATGLDPTALLNSHVRVTGAGRGVLTLDRRIVLGQLSAASAADLKILDAASGATALPSPLITAKQVQTLRLEDARRKLPVQIRGVITSTGPSYDYWLSVQDDTRGIFVDLHAITNGIPPCGELWEIIGHSGLGDFAPVVVADQITRLGEGRLPEPARPAWNELINGSMDVQWVEFQGLVAGVRNNTLSLLLSEGYLDVQMEGHDESELKRFEKSVVRIRGVLYALWNTGTRELRVGTFQMRNATVNVDVPAPADPFDAVLKTPRELLLFDAQATAFQRVRVRSQVVHAEAGRIFLMQDGVGLRVLPAQAVDVRAGDLVEAVGYPEIKGSSLLLREVIVRKTGATALPVAKSLADTELMREGLDSTLVRVEGKLIGLHTEQGVTVLEMQSGRHLFLARLSAGNNDLPSLRVGSTLGLNGVYAGQGRNGRPGAEAESFELLLNSAADVVVVSQSSWWTLQRLLIIVGILVGVLMFALVWITQLRRKVEQRTRQLQREIRERERAERQHALEAERSRIARDLHDDLGSSLTEIGVLASTGQRPQADESAHTSLFRAIAGKARGLIAALDVIVWAVDPEDNSLQSLADYLSGFAGEYLSHSDLACRFKVPVMFPPVTLDGQVRHGLLMALKESLNNIVRHAEATEVEFRMAVTDGALEIVIADNGKGFDPAHTRDGHGLKNLSARLEKLGGACVVESHPGSGTTVKIHLFLPASAATKADPAGV